jgi:hypothetical protein
VTKIGELGTTLALTTTNALCDSSHPDEGGAKLLRNVGSYNNDTA